MDIFRQRNVLFNVEKYKGMRKSNNNLTDQKHEIYEVASKDLADYKFKKMQRKYRPD
jgi:predicted lipase|tara:strand:- start:270 stop:440 length:171 start_codon:yes stop_codon:yes gene_type:complete